MKSSAIRRPINIGINWVYKNKLKAFLILLFILWAIIFIYSSWPKTVSYSFGGESCAKGITLLPSVHKSKNTQFNFQYQDKVTIFGKDVAANKVCFKLANLVQEDTQASLRLYPFDMTLLGKNYKIVVPSYPSIETEQLNLSAIPLAKEIVFPLDKKDDLFEYKLTIDNTTVNCLTALSKIECATTNLGLKHNTQYTANLDRNFNDRVLPVAELSIKTVEPVGIVDTSIKNGERVISNLENITIILDRPVIDISGLSLSSGENKIDVTSKIETDKITITLPKDLPRAADYSLSIVQMNGQSNETLTEPFKLDFRLEPGPQIAGSSLKDRATDYGANITLYFTQNLANTNYTNFVKLYQNDQQLNTSVYKSGNKLVINPEVNFTKCAAIKLDFNGVVSNEYGVSSNINWQTNSRARCAAGFSIGSSVEGRGIYGYSFGEGSKEVLYVGATHGDEKNSKRILEEWIWELEGNPNKIPAGTKVTVIPALNPDGVAKGSRYNAHGVDLNRNFPAFNWKSDIVVKDGSTIIGGGGNEPLSEPESRAIADYISSRRPNLVLTYHSRGGIVESNEASDANSKTQSYANLSGYGFKLASQNKEFFEYDVNGSMEEWAHDKLGQPTILVELGSKVYHEFSRNKKAMWAML